MAGNTAIISMVEFRKEWEAYIPIRELCERHSVSKDQILRLRTVWGLPLRTDRHLRFKPARGETLIDAPTPEDEAASQASCDLSPYVAAAVTNFHAQWSAETEIHRRVCKPMPLRLRVVESPPGIDLEDMPEGW